MSDTSPTPSAFPGFDIPEQNWFKMPNNWTDITAAMTSIAELKVVEYILKHTWGYQEYGLRKKITNEEFMHGRRRKDGTRLDQGTGLSKPSVIAGLKAAVERGLLLEEIDDADKARVKKYYSLRMMPGYGDESIENTKQPPEFPGGLQPKNSEKNLGVKNLYPGVKDLNAGVKDLNAGVKDLYPGGKRSLPRTEKETLERNFKQETNKNNNNNNNISNDLSLSQNVVVVALIDLGIGKRVAQKLAEEHTESYIYEKISFLEFLRAERPAEVQKPAGWLRKAIEDNYGPPDGYQSPADRAIAAAEQAQWEVEQAAEQNRLEAASEQRSQAEQKRREAAEQMRRTELLLIDHLQERYGTSHEARELWPRVLAALDLELTEAGRGHLLGSTLLRVHEGTALVALRNSLMLDWIKRQLSKKIERALAQQLGEPVTLEFTGFQEAEAALLETQS